VDRVDREVEEVYAAYPRKVGKGQAVRAIRSAMKLVGFELLLASVQAFADVVATWPESDRQFVPYPATWFNGRRWEDDRSTWARHRNPSDQRQASRPAERPAWVLQKIAGLRESLSAAERDLRIQVAQREHGNPCAEPERAQREVERIKSEILKLGEQP
jgi:hypothetical protein